MKSISFRENTSKLPRLDPDQNKSKINKIVGVGFSGKLNIAL